MFIGIETHGVHVPAAGEHRCLTFHSLFHSLDLVAVNRRLFKFQSIGRGFHLFPEFTEKLRGTAGKHVTDLLNLFMIETGIQRSRARCEALLHMVVETRPDAVLHGPVAAAAQRKSPVQKFPRFPGSQSRCIGAEIARPVVTRVAHNLKPRIPGLYVTPEKSVLLVVPQNNIVVGAVFLDETGLEKKSFLLRGRSQELYAHGVRKHGPGLDRQALGTKIRQYTPAQNAGLAHINHLFPRIPVHVDAGTQRYA